MIDHAFLDIYEAHAGDPTALPTLERAALATTWTRVDELLQDLHMIRHGYATDGYARHVERELEAHCTDPSVVDRLRRSGL